MKSWVAILIIYWLVIHKGRAKSISSVDLSATSAQTIMPLTTTDKPPTTTPETTTMPAPLCIHNGKPLVLGDSIANAENCSGVACTEDGLIHWDYFNCTPTTTPDVPTTTTTTPPQTTTTTTTPPPTTTTTTTPPPTTTTTTTTPPPTTTTSGLCLINGTYYPPESEVYRGYDASTNRCYGTIVHENCVVTNYEFYNCHPKTAPPPTPPPTTTPQTTTTTTPPPTTTPQTTTTTTPPPTTTPQTTTTTTPPPTTTPPTTLGACVHNGRGMKLNEVDTSSCAGAFCSAQGLVEWDHCGCFLGGHGMTLYRYGESILTDSRGCAGMTCTTNGFINWNNCTNTTTTPQSTTTTPDTTPSSTTPLSTTIPSCKYDGQVLELGDNKPTDSRWCSGVVCTENGIVHWDNFNCTATSTPQINTTSPATTTRSTTTPTTTIPAPPCKYNGQAYALGDVIPNDNRWCSGVTCTKNGLIPWDYFNCTSTTNPQTITTTAQGKKTDDPNKIKKKRMKEMIKKMMKLEKLMEIKMDKTITKWGLSEIKLMGKKPFKKLKMKLTRSRSPMEAFKVLIEFKESFAKLINRMRGKIMKNKEKKSAK